MNDYDYKNHARYYDIFELEGNSGIENLNKILDKLFQKYNVETVLDITCGTGAQAIYLHKKGYNITASDLDETMISIAREKYPKLDFQQADMRSSKIGEFDAVISIFNAIGHLSKSDFKKALINISNNLKEKGLYIFDIFNLDFMKENFINYEFIDFAKQIENTKYVRFNDNDLDPKRGIMNMNQTMYIQEGLSKPEIIKESWDMKIYSADQLKDILEKTGFKAVKLLNLQGEKLNKKGDKSILTVAQKK